MELEEFVKRTLVDLDTAVEDARKATTRDIRFADNANMRTVEFDIAVTVEGGKEAKGKAGIKVFEIIQAGGDVATSNKNSTVSRIQFGVKIKEHTKQEEQSFRQSRQSSPGLSYDT